MLAGENPSEASLPSNSIYFGRRYALAASVAYFALTCLWIECSTSWVAHLANGSVERLEHLQKMKGFAFMLVSAIAFYFSVRWVSKRTARSARTLHETQERWMEAERQAAPALLASCIAHDVANLLTVIRLNLERMKRFETLTPALTETIAKLDSGTDRLTELVKRLRGASSSLFQDQPARFDFSKCVEETLSLMQGHTCCETATIEFQGLSGTSLRGYPILVHQLAMNLMINAAEATNRVGHVRFTVGSIESGVCLSVEDDGPGVEPNLRKKVLSAFFTTKSTGSGLGLTSVRSCVDIHQGTMEITDSDDLGGARFTVVLPDLTDERVEQLRHPENGLLSRLQPESHPN